MIQLLNEWGLLVITVLIGIIGYFVVSDRKSLADAINKLTDLYKIVYDNQAKDRTDIELLKQWITLQEQFREKQERVRSVDGFSHKGTGEKAGD